MNRVIFMADLHVRFKGDPCLINFLNRVQSLVDMSQVKYIILGGDLADYSRGIQESLETVVRWFPEVNVAFVAGNHDLWSKYWRRSLSSDAVLYDEIPKICEEEGVAYLENECVYLDNWLLAGSIGWYDYSSKREGPPEVRLLPDEYYALDSNKRGRTADGLHVDFCVSDKELAEDCTSALVDRLYNNDCPDIDHFAVFTHVPLFAEAIQWKGLNWNLGCQYFYNLSMGDELLKFPKLKLVASGHTHHGVEGSQTGVSGQEVVHIVSSADYLKPKAYILDLYSDGSVGYSIIT